MYVDFLRLQPFVSPLCDIWLKEKGALENMHSDFAVKFIGKDFNQYSMQLLSRVPLFTTALCNEFGKLKTIQIDSTFIPVFIADCPRDVIIKLLKAPSFAKSFYPMLPTTFQNFRASPDFISSFMEECFTVPDETIQLFKNQKFVDLLISYINKPFRIDDKFASWFITEGIKGSAFQLLNSQYFIDSFNEIEEIDISSEVIEIFLTDESFRQQHAQLLTLYPFVNSLCRVVAEIQHDDKKLVDFLSWSLKFGLPMSAAQIFEVESFAGCLYKIAEKATPLIVVHPNFASCYILENSRIELLEKYPVFATALCQGVQHINAAFAFWSMNTGFVHAQKLFETQTFISQLCQIITEHAQTFSMSDLFIEFVLSTTKSHIMQLLKLPNFIDSIRLAFERKQESKPKAKIVKLFATRLNQAKKGQSVELSTAIAKLEQLIGNK